MTEFLSVSQVARRLGFREWAIRRAIADGRLTAHKPCGRLRISEEAVAEFLRAAEVAPAAPPPSGRSVVAVSASRSYPAAGSFRARLRAKEGQ